MSTMLIHAGDAYKRQGRVREIIGGTIVRSNASSPHKFVLKFVPTADITVVKRKSKGKRTKAKFSKATAGELGDLGLNFVQKPRVDVQSKRVTAYHSVRIFMRIPCESAGILTMLYIIIYNI